MWQRSRYSPDRPAGGKGRRHDGTGGHCPTAAHIDQTREVCEDRLVTGRRLRGTRPAGIEFAGGRYASAR